MHPRTLNPIELLEEHLKEPFKQRHEIGTTLKPQYIRFGYMDP